MQKTFMKTLVATLATFALACGGGSSSTGGGGSTGGGETPVDYSGPMTSSDIAAGQASYEANCSGCHPDGGSGVGPAITELSWDAATMRRQVREGEDRMPAFAADRVSDGDLEAMLAYLASIGSVASEDAAPAVDAPTDDAAPADEAPADGADEATVEG